MNIPLFLLISASLCNAAFGAPKYFQFGRLRVYLLSNSVFRVTVTPTDTFPTTHPSLVVLPENVNNFSPPTYKVTKNGGVTLITTPTTLINVTNDGNVIGFFNSRVNPPEPLLVDAGRQFTKRSDGDGYTVSQSWVSASPGEQIYGLGEYQNGLSDFGNGFSLDMIQFNTQAIIPFFVSTKGYGLYWDNPSITEYNPPNTNCTLMNVDGEKNVTAPPVSMCTFVPQSSGVFYIRTYSGKYQYSGTGSFSLAVNGEWIQNFSLHNAPQSTTAKFEVFPSQVGTPLKIVFVGKQKVLQIRTPGQGIRTMKSDIGDLIDYYVMNGGDMDRSIAGYRTLTGVAPLYPLWAYGFWQCKEHYHNQTELLTAAHGFRSRKIPVDVIVQDWHYWGDLGWGPHWDPKIYPDPAGMVKELKSINMSLMVSVWSKFDKSTTFYQQMLEKGFIINDSIYYDPYNPDARKLYYSFIKKSMFDIGVDAIWLDATEPEGFPHAGKQLHLGSGYRYFNPYSLMVTTAVADNWRNDEPERRVFTLTRSAFAGQQRTGGTLWSGDIQGAWDSLRRQVLASLNYAMSGIPYWSEDIGGFSRPHNQYVDDGYHHLLIRWFQFGMFTPIFRVHGGGSNTEIWNYGSEVERIVNNTITFRYRLIPYIYSMAYLITTQGYTLQRSMAFMAPKVSNGNPYNFMFGPSLFVVPMVDEDTSGMNTITIEFPTLNGKVIPMIDFFTGKPVMNKMESFALSMENLPVFVMAGTILPMAGMIQSTREAPFDPLEIRLYGGDDAVFSLYEDDGLSKTNLAAKKYSLIRFEWEDMTKTLVISSRIGSFPGMLAKRTFNLVVVRPGHGVGIDVTAQPDKSVVYTGQMMRVQF